jgi:hypothetical protein
MRSMDISIRSTLQYIDIHFLSYKWTVVIFYSRFSVSVFSLSSHESHMNLSRTNHRLPLVSVSSLRTPLAVLPLLPSTHFYLHCPNLWKCQTWQLPYHKYMFASKAFHIRCITYISAPARLKPLHNIPPTVFFFWFSKCPGYVIYKDGYIHKMKYWCWFICQQLRKWRFYSGMNTDM